MDEAAERKMEIALGEVSEAMIPKPTPIRPTPPIDDQLMQIERIEHAIRNRIRTDKLAILAGYERSVAEFRTTCEQKISDAIYQLQNQRDQSLRTLHEETQRKLHELNRQAERVERG